MTRPSYYWPYEHNNLSRQTYARPLAANTVAIPRIWQDSRHQDLANTTSASPAIALEFVTPPPREVQRGSPIHDPVTLLVRAVSPVPDPLHQYFAVASLVSSDEHSIPPQGTLTGPRLADSIHACDTPPRSDVMGYLSFPYLAMQRSGSFKLRVTLMKLELGEGFGANAAAAGAAGAAVTSAAVALQAVESGMIEVKGGAQSYQSYY